MANGFHQIKRAMNGAIGMLGYKLSRSELVEGLRSKVSTVEQELAQTKAESQTQIARLETALRENEVIRKSAEARVQQVEESIKRHAEAEVRLGEEQTAEVQRLTAQFMEIKERHDAAAAEVPRLAAQLEEIQESHEVAAVEVQRLASQLAESDEKCKASAAVVQLLTEKVREREANFAASAAEVEALKSELRDGEARHAAATADAQRLTGELQRLTAELQGLQVKHTAATAEVQITLESLRAQAQARVEQEQFATIFRSRAEELSSILSRREAELGSNREQLSNLLRSIAALSNTVAQLTRETIARPPRASRTVGPKPVVVVVVTTLSQFPHLRALCLNPEFNGAYEFVIVAYVEIHSSGLREFCVQHQIALIHEFELIVGERLYTPYQEIEDTVSSFTIPTELRARSDDERETMRILDEVLTEVRQKMLTVRRCQRVLDQFSASLLVMFEDNAEYQTGIWTTVARAQLIPAVIIPFTIADQLEPAEAHYNDERHWAEKGLYNRLVASRFPHWTYNHQGRWLTRQVGLSVLAIETLGLSAPDPWVLNSSKADVIAVESPAMDLHYQKLGLPTAQLRITGSLIDDQIYAALRRSKRIKQKLSLDPDRPVFLCGLPANQLTANRPTCEFREFEGLLDFWYSELEKLHGWQVIVKPHPSNNPQEVDYMRRFSYPVSDLDTSELIAICDIYNTSVSSTIRWALACGKPVLNFDVFQYHYREFLDEPGVLTVATCAEFSAQMSRLADDNDFLTQLTDNAKKSGGRWGMLDGHSNERFRLLLDQLIKGELPPIAGGSPESPRS